MKKKFLIGVIGLSILTLLTGCEKENTSKNESSSSSNSTSVAEVEGVVYSASDLFTTRDLEQTADLSNATTYTVTSGEDITITKEGVYVLKGSAKEVTVLVEAEDTAKVQIVLDGVQMTNTNFPCIYVKTADKVFITTTNTENTLTVENTFTSDGSTSTDGVIFSKQDITFNGTGTLTISSSKNGIVGKDDVKITGGTYNITAVSKCIEAHDSIRIAGGTLNLIAGTDGLHAEYDEDDSVGYIYIGGGNITIQADDDGIHATTVVQIDDGTLKIEAVEGIEGTYIQINGGEITIDASDDGINAASKSNSYQPTFEMNGGDITITMASGDTDGVDSNGNIYINGGTIRVTGNSTFDYDGTAEYNGGTIIANGEEIDYIPNQMMGGPGGGNRQGGRRGR